MRAFLNFRPTPDDLEGINASLSVSRLRSEGEDEHHLEDYTDEKGLLT